MNYKKKITITQKDDLLDAIVYYPALDEIGWTRVKKNTAEFIKKDNVYYITVADIAKYLIQSKDKTGYPVDKIWEIYDSFDIKKLGEIETCPPCCNDCKSQYYLRGGNKRSVAYAMRLIKDKIEFTPVQASHISYFNRDDDNNLVDLPTTHDPLSSNHLSL